MNDIAIKVEGLSKQYQIGGRKKTYGTLRDTLANAFVAPFRRAGKLMRGQATSAAELDETIWALKDISFSVKHGDVVGIIGRNGAGKSTLLKILSRITEPTEGRIRIRGRVSSLLEVGTGFHPELTGRENVYLNSAILGMRKTEVNRKFDEIVAFSEIEKFLDTPVKFYSSGMRVRLAFAVAAHLQPDILLVDEVLAVGDAAFQQKCLGKMGNVAKQGRTVLFVSHNMPAVLSLCTKAHWLDNGEFAYSGSVDSTVKRYLQSTISASMMPLAERKDRNGDGSVLLTSISVESVNKQKGTSTISCTDGLCIKIGYQAAKTLQRPRFSISIYSHTNVRIYRLESEATGELQERLAPSGQVTCITEPIHLIPGQYFINVAVYNGGSVIADHVQHAYNLTIQPVDFYGTGKLPSGSSSGLCLIGQTWLNEV